jgi:hypothetical protein
MNFILPQKLPTIKTNTMYLGPKTQQEAKFAEQRNVQSPGILGVSSAEI